MTSNKSNSEEIRFLVTLLRNNELGLSMKQRWDAAFFLELLANVVLKNQTVVPQPIDVLEKLPQAYDCNAGGRCWWFDGLDDGEWLLDAHRGRYTHWLPFWSIPTPYSKSRQ